MESNLFHVFPLRNFWLCQDNNHVWKDILMNIFLSIRKIGFMKDRQIYVTEFFQNEAVMRLFATKESGTK